MEETISLEALNLLEAGWRANLAPGSITRIADKQNGVVGREVWQAIKNLQSDHRSWQTTGPGALRRA